jgi:hypothetical protein
MLPLELIFQRSANGGGSFRWYHADARKLACWTLRRTWLRRAKKIPILGTRAAPLALRSLRALRPLQCPEPASGTATITRII